MNASPCRFTQRPCSSPPRGEEHELRWRGLSDPDVAFDEFDHMPEHGAALGEVGRGTRLALHVEVLERDRAAGLGIGGAEALRLVAVEARFDVLVVVHDVTLRL